MNHTCQSGKVTSTTKLSLLDLLQHLLVKYHFLNSLIDERLTSSSKIKLDHQTEIVKHIFTGTSIPSMRRWRSPQVQRSSWTHQPAEVIEHIFTGTGVPRVPKRLAEGLYTTKLVGFLPVTRNGAGQRPNLVGFLPVTPKGAGRRPNLVGFLPITQNGVGELYSAPAPADPN